MKRILFLCSLFLLSVYADGQSIYISSGKITYERKKNLWIEMSDNFFEEIKKQVPQYKTDEFVLTFNSEKSLYAPKGEVSKVIVPLPADDNIVYTDFNTQSRISHKNILGKNYLIEDALRNAEWKIKDDFREIAGFNCRRATTILFDSVFVVAFYTDAIIPSAGPESFTGLPGTIMGLVINRLHTSWYATKVEVAEIESKSLVAPIKGTKTTPAKLENDFNETIKNFGTLGASLLWLIYI